MHGVQTTAVISDEALDADEYENEECNWWEAGYEAYHKMHAKIYNDFASVHECKKTINGGCYECIEFWIEIDICPTREQVFEELKLVRLKNKDRSRRKFAD